MRAEAVAASSRRRIYAKIEKYPVNGGLDLKFDTETYPPGLRGVCLATSHTTSNLMWLFLPSSLLSAHPPLRHCSVAFYSISWGPPSPSSPFFHSTALTPTV